MFMTVDTVVFTGELSPAAVSCRRGALPYYLAADQTTHRQNLSPCG
jgi:hypothetical protein